MDVGENSTSSDGDSSEKLVQLLVIADGQLDVTGNDTGLLVVTSSVASQLQDLSGKVLKNSGEVHGGTSSNPGGVLAVLQVAVDTSNGELKSCLLGAGNGLASLALSSSCSSLASLAGHFVC